MSMKAYMDMKFDSLKQSMNGQKQDKLPGIDLPLGLRIGSRVSIEEAPFLLAGEEGPEYPGQESLIEGGSCIDIYGLTVFRLYLKDRGSATESMLMLVMDGEGDIAEYYLFRELAEVPLYFSCLDEVPLDGDEANAISFWIGEDKGIIGLPVFFTPEGHEYARLWESDVAGRVSPVSFSETIHFDAFNPEHVRVQHLGCMLYTRSIQGLSDETDEFLLVSVERGDNSFSTRIWTGLILSEADLQFPDSIKQV